MFSIIPSSIGKSKNPETLNTSKNPIIQFRTTLSTYFKTKKVLPENSKKDTSHIDITNDITTYIRCLFHDFRGPLNNITLGIELLLESENKESDKYNILKSVRDSCLFLSDSLDGFLNVRNNMGYSSDFVEIKYEPFNIVGLVKKMQYILLFTAMKKNIKINYIIKPIQEWVIGDYKNIQHVLMNLLSNAIKYSNSDSTIEVKLECIETVNKKQHFVITVIDQNDYIDKDIKNRLFEKYNTSNDEIGTGLGLYICKKIIELHGGKINHFNNDVKEIFINGNLFDKDTNRGNIFKIDLFLDVCPSSNSDMEKLVSKKNDAFIEKERINNDNDKIDMLKFINIENKGAAEPIGNNSKLLLEISKFGSTNSLFIDSLNSKTKKNVNVMIVDDSDMSRKLLNRLLQNKCKNIRVFEAIDGIDALLKTVGFKDKLNDSINMMLIDNVMPNLTGELLSKILRGIGYTGIIIGITGNGLEEDKEKFVQNGADFVFTKPFTMAKLDMLLLLLSEEGYESKEGKRLYEKNGKLGWGERTQIQL